MILDLGSVLHTGYYILGAVVLFAIGWLFGVFQSKNRSDERLKKSRNFQRGVLKGTISEQLAPYLPDFPKDLKTSEARFMGKPIDFIVFKGIDDNNISEVVFVEVKSGRNYLNSNERSLKDAIENKKVRYVHYQVPELKIVEKENI